MLKCNRISVKPATDYQYCMSLIALGHGKHNNNSISHMMYRCEHYTKVTYILNPSSSIFRRKVICLCAIYTISCT